MCRGAFSEVYRAVDKKDGKEYAIKIINKAALKGKEDSLDTEVNVLAKYANSVPRGSD